MMMVLLFFSFGVELMQTLLNLQKFKLEIEKTVLHS